VIEVLQNLQNVTKIPELKRRVLVTLGLLAAYRLGAHVPTPGVDGEALSRFFDSVQGTLLGLVDLFSGGNLRRLTVFALGIMPYISASIILQLLTVVIPALERLAKEGEAGRKKITQYTRYGTIVLSAFQSLFIAYGLESMNDPAGATLVPYPGWGFRLLTMMTLTAGTALIMWLGEQISEKGIGNGISLIIFAGIVVRIPSALVATYTQVVETKEIGPLTLVAIAALMVAVTAAVVIMQEGQRKIPVQYAKRVVGRRVYGGQSTHIPLRINTAGVIPVIFASSIILFPATAASWFMAGEGMTWLKDIASTLVPGQPVYVLLYAAAIVFFCFFYTALQYNPKETAENLKKSGAFVPGIRPGEQTAKYLERIMLRLTLVGSIYVVAICLIPEFLILRWNVPFYFGGTSLLIIVVVTMDFMAQVQAYVMSHQYESLLKKASFRGAGFPTR
jgi:preprotein translocase subunit SecY